MLKIGLLLNRLLPVLIVALVAMGGMMYAVYDLETKSNIKIIQLESDLKSSEEMIHFVNTKHAELEKINAELLQIPDYLRDDYLKQNYSSDEFISAEKFLNEIEISIPVIFTAAIKGEIKDNSSFTVYGQVPYADSTVSGTIFRGNINNAAIIEIFQVTSNEFGQYSQDVVINSDQLWRIGNYTLSIQNEGVFKELAFAYAPLDAEK